MRTTVSVHEPYILAFLRALVRVEKASRRPKRLFDPGRANKPIFHPVGVTLPLEREIPMPVGS